MEHESNGNSNCGRCISKGAGRLANKRTSKDHPEYNIKIGQNTEKSPGDLRRLSVTQTTGHNPCDIVPHRLALVTTFLLTVKFRKEK